MSSCVNIITVIGFLSTISIRLAAKDPVVAVPLGEHRPSRSNKIEDYVAPSLCDMLKLHRRQKRMCKRGHGVAETLLDATSLSVEECQAKFRTERWNCTLGKYRENILKKSYKETSFLYSITSAGLVHAFARACSLQKLDRCTCDEELSSRAPRSTWIWGGCGDNIRYGLKFTRRFLGRGRKSGKDVRAEVDHHNSNLGMKVVKDHVHTTCKCHGISGSCTSKTCWRQLLPFSEIAAILKMKYERAVKVDSFKNQATGKSKLVKVRKTNSRKTRPAASPRKGEMVFLETSPSFCKRTRYSMGTSGRTCEKKSNCDVVCCGRGYNAKNAVVKKACQCKVVWCCYVECKQCEVTEEMHSCK